MKKSCKFIQYLRIVLLLIISFYLVGCGNNEKLKSDPIIEKNNRTTIRGEFTVGVRDVIPDYCFDGVTPCVALVTEFQSYPFTIFVGEEIGKQLEIGTQYVFSIEPIEVNYSLKELENMRLSSLVWEVSGFKITGFRVANEDELGLDSLELTFEEVNN